MRLSVASLRRVVKGDLRIEFVRQDLTSYGGLELLRRYTRRIGLVERIRVAGAEVGERLRAGPPPRACDCERKTKLVTAYQGVDFLGYRLIVREGRLHVYISPKVLERFRAEVRRLTRRTAGRSLRVVLSRLDRYVRGWGEYFKRAEVAGVFNRYDRWITRRLRAYLAKRWRNGLWRTYPDQWFWFHLGLARLYHLRRNFIRELQARRGAGNRPVERSAGNPHATFVRGTEASS